MSKRAFRKIKSGLEDARAFLNGTADIKLFRVRKMRAPVRRPGARCKLLKN